MRNKKFLILASLTLALPVFAVLAQAPAPSVTGSTQVSQIIAKAVHPAPQVITITSNGNVLLRGVVESVSASTNSFVVKSWGGNWTVNVQSNAQMVGKAIHLVEYRQGDFVGVSGTINSDAAFTVHAKVVRNWTDRNDNDHDGKTDTEDTDDDNDGIADPDDAKPFDHDNDGMKDVNDSDDDNDGVVDAKDAKPFDHDNDGTADAEDEDDDNDGALDVQDTKPFDHDNDGIRDDRDSDDDNDGTPDSKDQTPLGDMLRQPGTVQ